MTTIDEADLDDPEVLEQLADFVEDAAAREDDVERLRALVLRLRHALTAREEQLRRLSQELDNERGRDDTDGVSVEQVLETLHRVLDEGIDALYGTDVACPWTRAEPRPPRMTAGELKALRRASAARARAAKRVGRGRGRVRAAETAEDLRAAAESTSGDIPEHDDW